MLKKDMSKSQIETILNGKGDFVQIHELKKLIETPMVRDTKKFIYLRLAELYKNNRMYNDAAKMYDNLAIICIPFTEKIKYYMKEAQLYILTGDFYKVDRAMRKAMGEANASQKAEIFFTIKDFYIRQAENYIMSMKRNNAVKIYEKLLEMNITQRERKEFKKKLIELYSKLGKYDKVKMLEQQYQNP